MKLKLEEIKNPLKQMAKWAKKRQKGLGAFVKLNAGNVEQGNQMFNRATTFNIDGGEGLGEALTPIDKEATIIELTPFKKCMKNYNLDDEDLTELKQQLIERAPEASLGSNIYKFRWAPSKWNRGSNKATRVIYVDIIKKAEVYLVTMYTKKDKSNLTPEELKNIKYIAKQLNV